MAKRIISVWLALCICMSFSVVVASAKGNNTQKTLSDAVYMQSDENGNGDYSAYCEKIGASVAATQAVNAGDVTSLENVPDNSGTELSKEGDEVSYTVKIENDGWYQPVIFYKAVKAQDNDIEVGFKVDGGFPYSELEAIPLTRLWIDATDEILSDEQGNEFSPEQIESLEWQSSHLRDINGFITTPLLVWLGAGQHTFTVVLNSEKVVIGDIRLDVPENVMSDSEWREEINKNSYSNYSGNEIVIEGEKASSKSSRFLTPLSNRSNATVLPSDPYRKTVNYIGGSNWNSVGDTLTWKFEVPEDGLYKIGFHYHQTYLQEGASYRTLRIDGEIPFEAAQSVTFGYDTSWQFMTLKDSDGAVPVYLTAGTHELSLSVTLGKLSDFSAQLKELVAEIGAIYRQIVMITGETPDSERDYNLFTSIPDLESDLERIEATLESLADESEELSGSKGSSSAQILRKAALTISQMLKTKYKAQTKLSAYYNNYAGLSSWLYEMQNMALDIDCIVLASPEKDFVRTSSTLVSSFVYTLKRLTASFMDDYSVNFSDSGKESITIWSNWGMDQLNMISALIESDFTPKTGIKVNLRITNASIIQGNLSGNGPDVEIMIERTAPVNYAMRNALLDLSQFEDFDEVSERFLDVAFEPYKYKDGVYALPDTEIFSMLFVRTDIFEELNLSIPKTWDEFLQVSKVLSLNNTQVAVGETANFFLSQKGVSLYNEDRTATNLTSSEAINCLTFWTDLYTKYNLPKTYDFYSRFRSGLIPMGIQSISFYSVLKSAAPEINGKWVIAPVPGFVNEDGDIDNVVVGTGNASVILKSTKNKEGSWEFLKWWSSDDIQYRFASGVESVLGESGRHLTANTSALQKLGWDSSSIASLMEQREKLVEIPEVPGSYYVSRSVQQIYWNVVNNGENVKDMVNKWVPEADEEIARKTAEYAQ